MRVLANERGAALITALLLTMLSLVIALTLMYTAVTETKMSASQKRYQSALAATHGGVQVITREVIPLIASGDMTEAGIIAGFAAINLDLPKEGCLAQKLTRPNGAWSAECRSGSSDPVTAPDLSFKLGALPASQPGFTVYAQIRDTVVGNSDRSGFDFLEPGGAVTGNDDTVAPKQIPGLYHLSVQGVRPNDREKARLTVLYAY